MTSFTKPEVHNVLHCHHISAAKVIGVAKGGGRGTESKCPLDPLGDKPAMLNNLGPCPAQRDGISPKGVSVVTHYISNI